MSQKFNPSSMTGVLNILIAAMLWGTVGVASRWIGEASATTPLSIGFFRLAIAGPLLGLIGLLVLGRRMLVLQRKYLIITLLMGAMLAIYQLCFFTAITYVGVAIATLVTLCSAPMLVTLLAVLLKSEPFQRTTLIALGIALLGTALLVGAPEQAVVPERLLAGVALALGSGFGYALMALMGRRVANHAHSLQINAIAFLSGAMLLWLLTLPHGPIIHYPAFSWALLCYLGVVPSALGYVLFMRGMRETPASIASLLTLIEPLTATLLAWALFREQLGGTGLLGALLLIGALVLLAKRS